MLRFVGVEVSDAKVIQGIRDHNTSYYSRSYITPVRFEKFARQAKRGVDAQEILGRDLSGRGCLWKFWTSLQSKHNICLRYVIGSRLRDE